MSNIHKLPKLGQALATVHPELVEEWAYDLNEGLKPDQVFVNSGKKVWWKCKNCGMHWQARIQDRTRGCGCPYDAGKLPIPSKTDLATVNPQLAEEWDYERNGMLKPEQFVAHSGKKVWWLCRNCGMSWQATIDSRTRGKGCPYDAGRYPIPDKTDLATINPQLAEEWDYERNGSLTPMQVTAYSNKKVWWKCKNCGMSWQAVVGSRSKGSGCPYDAGKYPIPGKTDLATINPQLAEEWDYERNDSLTPVQVTANSGKKVWWKCKNCGMHWQATIEARSYGEGCPYDAGKHPIPGKTDLAAINPQLAEEWDYERNDSLTPVQVAANSGKKVWWKCKNCGMHWQATIASRSRGSGCPYDAGLYPIPGKNDLATINPQLSEEWDYERNGNLTPAQVTAYSGKKVWWKCKNCGIHWQATVINRIRGNGCPYDTGRYSILGKTDLATINPPLVEEWDYEQNVGISPERVAAYSNKKVWWKCRDCGMVWKAAICNRSCGTRCPRCRS